ncbi:hypothetical protein [Streptomyces sp. NBC_00696]|uniref:hypothetical protein n=1 Tax=Streptomyces sp. NBC_00696 TaxID=2903672 RepID=UPI002E3261B2|nr:hypothetical protein [Streptomyces sp. NBC_00696]
MTAYVLDTGIEQGHSEFSGRATSGFDAMGTASPSRTATVTAPTSRAPWAARRTYGVAGKANLASIRVLACEGSSTYSTNS